MKSFPILRVSLNLTRLIFRRSSVCPKIKKGYKGLTLMVVLFDFATYLYPKGPCEISLKSGDPFSSYE